MRSAAQKLGPLVRTMWPFPETFTSPREKDRMTGLKSSKMDSIVNDSEMAVPLGSWRTNWYSAREKQARTMPGVWDLGLRALGAGVFLWGWCGRPGQPWDKS